MAINKVGTSFRLSPIALNLISQIADKLGLSQAAVIEMSVRKMAQTEDVYAKGSEEADKVEA